MEGSSLLEGSRSQLAPHCSVAMIQLALVWATVCTAWLAVQTSC
jgi:hypothetical protein